jgi:hypothetical protein
MIPKRLMEPRQTDGHLAQPGPWGLAALKRLVSIEPGVRRLAWLCAVILLVVALLEVLGPMLGDFSTYGFHDWDVETAYRYITVLSLKEYGEGPWWHPWLCGGAPAWGYVEGASNLVSPYLPVYLLFDIRTAIRIEVLGAGLMGLAGAYLFASAFTRSIALRALVAALWVLNGRWALQAAVGHTWHLQYGLMPWAFFFFERARHGGSLRSATYAGMCIALMVYWGGIYPVPHTALLLTLYAALLALFEQSIRPLAALAIAGAVAVGLSAPKLFAVMDHMQDVPRLIESKEVIGFAELLVMLTDPTQRYGSRPVRVPAYNWHEWGIYVGTGGLVLLFIAIVFAHGKRENALKILGFLCLFLGFGAFNPGAPWALLHELPVFASQHVPSRFHYPMLLMLSVAFVATVARVVDRALVQRPWLDLALLVIVGVFAFDLVRVSRVPFAQAFWMQAPAAIHRAEQFEHRTQPKVQYVRRDWAPPMLLSMMANTGVIECYGIDPNFRPAALAADDPRYRGEAYVAEGEGRAKVVEWTPNRARVRVDGARSGALVVYNMNYDRNWWADGQRALEHEGLVAARLKPGAAEVRFRYFPGTLAWSVPLAFLTLAACFVRRPHLARLRARLRKNERAPA